MNSRASIHEVLRAFAASVTEKTGQITPGDPEDQLRAPFETFMAGAADALGSKVVCTGEARLSDHLGRPDYAIHRNDLLAGYVELKAPGAGADGARFKGHNREQFKRFSNIPNILYTDGNEWALYRRGKLERGVVRLSGNVAKDGPKAAKAADARAVEVLLRDFLQWQPFLPRDGKGGIDLKRFAGELAPLCRFLRDDVIDALRNPASSLVHLAKDWRQLLFPDAADEQFADAYAQTVTFALLLGRSEGADPLTLENAQAKLKEQHNLLSRALQVLTVPEAREETTASLNLLLRVLAIVPLDTLSGSKDPWLYFYEDFLAAYNPKLRKDAGVYYTPVEVVRAQIRLIDSLLVKRLNKPLGFADPGVVTLDPAVGTGTYLLGVIEHALRRVETEQGTGAVAGQAAALAENLYGFELMVGPYAVAELRVSRALREHGATMPAGGTQIYLTNTLESPHAEPPQMPLILQPIADQHEKALKVKSEVPVIVCLGNPPYDRHDAVDAESETDLARAGGWVRFGDPLPNGNVVKDKRGRDRKLSPAQAMRRRRERAILNDFLDPAKAAGHGVRLKNLYNLYVYFWRWALWKAFEHDATQGTGIVSFISASSYLDGDAFCGMREHMRRLCDEIWILDIGGEGRGLRRDENVFAIQTPVAISVAFRSNEARSNKPATTRYARIEGKREVKLDTLDAINDFASVEWRDCPDDWRAPFRPAGEGEYFDWPLLTDLMPWQQSGVQLKRTWPIAPNAETLERRWRALLQAADRSEAFRETEDRTVSGTYRVALAGKSDSTPIAKLPSDAPLPKTQRYAYRSFDRHYVIADGRLISRPRPDLWRVHGERQMYLTSLHSQALGAGPALTASALIPDLHHFQSGGKDVIPLYRAGDASETNILPGLLDFLGAAYEREVAPEDFAAYVYGALAQPAFTSRFENELGTNELRVPLTQDAALFERLREVGARLLWLHTYGERLVPDGESRGRIPHGKARCVKAVPREEDGYPEKFHYAETTRTLHVGAGEFSPVPPEVYDFRVSNLKPVQSWLKYRMKKGAGRKSSPLDDIRPKNWTGQFTTELLELIWSLEATVAGYPEQAKLLEAVTKSECLKADEIPDVPTEARRPPAAPMKRGAANALPL